MGYRSQNKRNSQFRARPPKGPVKLSFGIVEPTPDPNEPKPVVKPQEMVFAKQDLIGTLTQKNVNIEAAPPLPAVLLERILANLEKILQEGRFSNSRAMVDYEAGELLVSFSYDQLSIDRIKGLDRNERAWNPDAKCWRIYPAVFDDIFDILGRGVKLTEPAYNAIKDVVNSKYYANIGRGKLGKLIIRESWFEELDLQDMPELVTAHGSNASLEENTAPDIQEAEAAVEKTPEATPKTKPKPKKSKQATDVEASPAPGDAPVSTALSIESIRNLISDYTFKRKPFKHQFLGMEYLLANPEAALLDEMGCGKSLQIASSLGILFKNKMIDRVLIVAPMSLIKTWQDELRLATDEPFIAINGTPSQRAKAMANPVKIFIVHYEGLRLEEERLSEWLKAGRSVLVFDESQRIKNLTAQTTMAALKLRTNTQRCIIATGTPIANRPLDLFAQYLVMDNGRTFGTKYQSFKNTFCEMEIQNIKVGRKTIRVERFLGVRNGTELRNRIMRTSLRRLKSEVLDLPPILYKDYVVELRAEQRSMYHQMRDTLKVTVSKLTAGEVISEASTIMVQLLRLSQIASNPQLLDEGYEGSNAKVSELEDLLEDIFADDTKKVILWSHYVSNVNLLVEKFAEKYKAVGHTGEMAIDVRQASISAFQDDPETKIFIATPQSAKEGLTLIPRDGKMRADTMIYMDLSFDSGSYAQSQARFHRIGQTAERCLVIHLIGEGTVDEYIRKSVVDKIQTASQVLDGNALTHSLEQLKLSNKLTKENILSIL